MTLLDDIISAEGQAEGQAKEYRSINGGDEIISSADNGYDGGSEENGIDVVTVPAINIYTGAADDKSISYVCDDSAYYINSRRIELAQFEASNPTPAQITAKFHSMFGYMINSKRLTVYKHIINQSQTKVLVHAQLARLADLVNRLNELLVIKVMEAAKEGKSAALAVSLPDIEIIPSIDRGVIFDSLLMDNAIESILQYMRELNVEALLKSPLDDVVDWSPLEKGPRYDPNVEEERDIRTKTIENMYKLLDAEANAVAQIRNIEKFHHHVLIRMGMVQSRIGKIIEKLR